MKHADGRTDRQIFPLSVYLTQYPHRCTQSGTLEVRIQDKFH